MDHISSQLDRIIENEKDNLSVVNFVEENPVYSVETTGDSILVRGVSDHPWIYIISKNEDELKELSKSIDDQDRYFAAIEDWMLPIVLKNRIPAWRIKTRMYSLKNDVQLKEPTFQAVPLCPTDAKVIYEASYFKSILSEKYIRERIMKGFSAGIYTDNKLVAWVLTHDDGAIGCLQVADEYQRKGYAYSVLHHLITKLRSVDKVPFLYVNLDNDATDELVRKFSFMPGKKVNWIHFE